MKSYIFDVNSAKVDIEKIRRVSRVKPQHQPDDYSEKFDEDTLWYDAISWDDKVFLVCPRLNNLENEIRSGKFFADGIECSNVKIKKMLRTDIISIDVPGITSEISFKSKNISAKSNVNVSRFEIFENLNCAFVINKNNDLKWISEFVKWHFKYHNLQGLVILENGSDSYTPTDIIEALKDTKLVSLLILNLPFRFGAQTGGSSPNGEFYLQSSSYNVLKLRFLHAARAVLCCDIDELVKPCASSIFDLAAQFRSGFVRFKGEMRYHKYPNVKGISQTKGYYQKPGDRPCPPKWCLIPNSKFKSKYWSVHSLIGLFWDARFIRRDIKYFHFFHVSTDWKGNRSRTISNLVEDHEPKKFLEYSN